MPSASSLLGELGKGPATAALRIRPARRATHLVVVGLDDLGETPLAGERASRRALPHVPERRPAARLRSPELLVAAAVLELADFLAHLLESLLVQCS